MQTHYLSAEGKEKLEAELKDLKLVKRREIADKIENAKALGDLSENAEYHEAKNQLAFVEGRVLEIGNILKNASIITETGGGDTVQIGCTIEVETRGEKKKYTIVGVDETDPLEGKISNESPLGESFIGHKVGDVVTVETPGGTRDWKIIAIS
ncbi:MAG: transcription elongation factor GreA [bacterium]|nr:transcription elongation factor GreA [bacterium]